MTAFYELMGPWFAFIAGAVTGSFANVCIYRIPLRQSIVLPSSHCIHCEEPIRWYDNIPIFSYLVLKGRCRFCQGAISFRYPLIELLTAVLFLGLWLRNNGSIIWFFVEVVFITMLLIGLAIDLEHKLLPDRITLSLLVFSLLVSFLPGGLSPFWALIGALSGGGLMYGIAVIGDAVYKRETMGGGDIKLSAAIGAFLGWKLLLVGLFMAFVLGAAGGLIYLVIGGRDKTIPFGPFLAAGALLALVIGQDLLTWYTGFLR